MTDANNASPGSNKDFVFVLDVFPSAYRPILEGVLKVAESAETLVQASQDHPPTREDEIKLARTLFERFFTPEVATRPLPDKGKAAF